MPGFSTVVAPLNLLIGHESDTAVKPGNKQCSIEGNAKADKAFEQLKQLLITTPVLVYPDFIKDFILEVDASFHGLGDCVGLIAAETTAYYHTCPRLS